jgi:hypothetical protein
LRRPNVSHALGSPLFPSVFMRLAKTPGKRYCHGHSRGCFELLIGLPIPRKQLGDPAGMIRQSGQDVGQPGVGTSFFLQVLMRL